jgi:very-short-patch-repair endonuclease
MSSEILSPEFEQQLREWLLERVPSDGSTVGNKTLREALEQRAARTDSTLTEEHFWQIRDALIAEGKLLSGRGRGGSVYRPGGTAQAMPIAADEEEEGDEDFWDEERREAIEIPPNLEKLRNRLLDLSARNRLLNFSHARSKRFVRVIDELPDQLFDTLLNDISMRFDPVPDPTEQQLLEDGYLVRDPESGNVSEARKLPSADVWAGRLGLATDYELPRPAAVADSKHQDRSIQTLYYPNELESRLQLLYAESRSALEETGANVLYLALGFLEWDESVAGKNSSRLAPLMLVPVRLDRGELNRKTSTYEYQVAYSGEDILTNLSLREKLRRDFSVALPAVRRDIKPEEYFATVVDTVLLAKPGWKVHRFASLGLFEFGKLMMYLDLDPNRWDGASLIDHALVQTLTGERDESEDTVTVSGMSEEYLIDTLEEVEQRYPLIDDADSSQHSAMIDVLDGKNLVIEGPPGTGKSQTITNMIAAAMAQGKRVLFVAEKNAALEVVKSRLSRAGLGDFCLELHSHKSQKQAVLARIGQRLQSRSKFRSPAQLKAKILRLNELKNQLNRHVDLLQLQFANTGMNTHQVLMQARRVRETVSVVPEAFHPSDALSVDHFRLREEAQFFASYFVQTAKLADEPGNITSHPWFGVHRHQLDGQQRAELLASLDVAEQALDELRQCLQSLVTKTGVAEYGDCTVDQLLPLAKCLAALKDVYGDEDWVLMPKLTAETCIALGEWLDQLDRLLQQAEQLGKAIDPAVLEDVEKQKQLQDALSVIRRHTNADVAISAIADLMQKSRGNLVSVDKLHAVVARVNASIPSGISKSLKCDIAGLEQISLLLSLAQCLPRELYALRNPVFDDETTDTLLENLELQLVTLQRKREQIAPLLRMEQLPAQETLEDLARVLADSSVFRWLKGQWRTSRKQARQLARPGVAFAEVAKHLSDAAQYQQQLSTLNHDASFQKLGALFQGPNTQLPQLKAMRAWYRQLREQCGRGFGGKVWISEWLLHAPADLLENLRAEATDLAAYISSVLAHKTALESMFPFDQHELRNGDLLAANGVFESLANELDMAISDLARHNRMESPTVDSLFDLAKRISVWRESAEHLHHDPRFKALCGDTQLPSIYEVANARKTLASWRHTTTLLAPVLAMPGYQQLLPQLLKNGPGSAAQLIIEWRTVGVALHEAIARWAGSFDAFAKIAALNIRAWWLAAPSQNTAGYLARMQAAKRRTDLLEHWLEYRRLRDRLVQLGFPSAVEATENRQIEPENCSDACLAGLLDCWAKLILQNHPELGQFAGKEQEAIRGRFAEIDHELKQLQREQIAWQIDQNKVPAGNNSGRVKSRTELALLEHEAGKQRRHEPIRTLMTRAKDALQALMPCFMMSPMAVAQYLPAGKVDFDLVIMDEASQVRPEEALGSIARGKQVVVVGDPKQLPPTNFFARQGGDEDMEGDETSIAQESESILDAAIPLFSLRRLRWHYRSRHESLIAFSNKAFYDSNLVIYPSPHSESHELGIKFVRVPRGRFAEQRNIEEAEAVVKAIEHHVLHSPHESLGVVSMNIKQKEQIERMLEERSKESAALREALEVNKTAHEPLFIKNLENVQGDERDVIYISSTYGPMEIGGRVPQRFGPINGPDGWRRLNVLYTRAKKRMQVFASFSAGDVLVTGTSSRGVQALRDFLQFAESGQMPQIAESGRDADSDFEIAVQDMLSRHGFECEAQIGVAGFFIDLAVRDPGKPGSYLMGIECDGASYHSAKSARDRDRLRQSILEQLGWKIRRIWSVDWFRNANAQLEPILDELKQLRSQPSKHVEQTESEEEIIEGQIQESTNHNDQFLLHELTGNLRDRLELFDQQIIRPRHPNTDPSRRLLRPAMIEALLEFKPATKWEFVDTIPGYLRSGTDPIEGEFLEDVLTLICEA